MAQHRSHRSAEFVALGNEFQNFPEVDDDFIKSKPKKRRYLKLLFGGLFLVACGAALLIHRRHQNELEEEEQFLEAERNDFRTRTPLPPAEVTTDATPSARDGLDLADGDGGEVMRISNGPVAKFHRPLVGDETAEVDKDPVVQETSLEETMDAEAHQVEEAGEQIYTPVHTVRMPKMRTVSLEHMKQDASKDKSRMIEEQLSVKGGNVFAQNADTDVSSSDNNIYFRPRPPYKDEPQDAVEQNIDPTQDEDDNGEYEDEDDQENIDGDDEIIDDIILENWVDGETGGRSKISDDDVALAGVRKDVLGEDVEVPEENVVNIIDYPRGNDSPVDAETLTEYDTADDDGDENVDVQVELQADDTDEEGGNEGVEAGDASEDPNDPETDEAAIPAAGDGDSLYGDAPEQLIEGADDDKDVEDEYAIDAEADAEVDLYDGDTVDDGSKIEEKNGNGPSRSYEALVDGNQGEEGYRNADGILLDSTEERGSPDQPDSKVDAPEGSPVAPQVEPLQQGGEPAAWYNLPQHSQGASVQSQGESNAENQEVVVEDTYPNEAVDQMKQYESYQNAQQQYAAQQQQAQPQQQQQVYVYTDPNTGEQRYIVY